jgi:hypothetical protein
MLSAVVFCAAIVLTRVTRCPISIFISDISLMSDLPHRSPVSILHVDLPITSCHSGTDEERGWNELVVGFACGSTAGQADWAKSAGTTAADCEWVVGDKIVNCYFGWASCMLLAESSTTM